MHCAVLFPSITEKTLTMFSSHWVKVTGNHILIKLSVCSLSMQLICICYYTL